MTLITQRPPRFLGHRPAVDVPFLGNQTWIDFIWRTVRSRLCWQNSQFEVYEFSLCARRQQPKKEMADGIGLVLAGAADERV